MPPDPPGSGGGVAGRGIRGGGAGGGRRGGRPAGVVRRLSSAVRLPLPDGVGQVRHPRGGLRADRLQGHAARVHALEQADSGAEQHG